MLRPQGHREELVKALPRELVKAPLRRPIWYPVHSGDSEEGLNRRGARDLGDSNATATRRRRDGDQTAQRGGNTGKALGSGNTGQLRRPHGIKGDSKEGLNRRGARNLMHTFGGGCRGNTGTVGRGLDS